MKLVVLGLSLSSSWGNGHATTYRALLRAFADRGHEVVFLERDVPWYAENRDLPNPGFCRLELYNGLEGLAAFDSLIRDADAAIVGSYVPDGVEAGERVLNLRAAGGLVTAFYDIDTPVTLAKLERGEFEYLHPAQIPRYDVYLSFTGGPTLNRLEDERASPMARALFCSVDATAYRPLPEIPRRLALGYLGTHSADRQPKLDALLVQPARSRPGLAFAVAGPQYPPGFGWPANVERTEHLAPEHHPAFYASQRLTLNVTRADMVQAGWSPSVRLFEAMACGTPVISDSWPGLGELFAPDREILIAETTADALKALDLPDERLAAIAGRTRAKVLERHTAQARAAELEAFLKEAAG